MNKPLPAFRLKPLALALLALGLFPGQPALAAPQDGSLAAGAATITQQGLATTIRQSSDRAIINWRGFSIGADELVRFIQPSTRSAMLNRVTGAQMSTLLGALQANGQVFLINPNGILIGAGARLDVGSLIATTSNLDDRDFLDGRLQFTQPGKPGSGIVNGGHITAAEGGLVALVAPNVRNDGIIEARLGKVLIGAADTFTLDLYGDGLLNLALGEQHHGALHGADGQAVDYLLTQAGQIHTDGGKTVLITAANAGTVLDKLINMQGTIRADTVASEGGRIVLSGAGGAVEVSGQIAATGANGGRIEVLGGAVHLAATARLDVSGTNGGGVIHVGGDWQGAGDTLRANTTRIDEGAAINVRAVGNGDGGEVVVWSDSHTAFAGQIDARGGESGGNGGRVEVSGKQTLDFAGQVDAGAALGLGGSLLLDPAIMNIGLTEAALINRVLKLGASTTVSASTDINVNSLIDGRGRRQGGGLSLIAGNDINLNEYVITNNGALNFVASAGTLNIAAGKAAFAGSGPISVTTGGDLNLASLYTAGALTARSTAGRITVAEGIDAYTGTVALRAALDLTVNQPIVNFLNGSSLALTSDSRDIVVNAQLDGRATNGVASGPVALSAGRHILLNESIVAEDSAISLTTGTGTVTPAAGKGLFSGNGPIAVTTGGNLTSGVYVTTGALALRSTGGNLTLGEKIYETVGDVSLRAATDVNIDQGIANIRNGSSLRVQADGGNINVNARIDAQDAASGMPLVTAGAVTLTAGNNVNINETIVTNDGAVAVTATHGTVAFSNGGTDGSGNKKIIAGAAPITLSTGGSLSTGTAPPVGIVLNMGVLASAPSSDDVDAFVPGALSPWVTLATTGKLTLVSTGGDVTIDAPIPQTTGEVEIRAGNNVLVREKLVNAYSQPISIVAGTACSAASPCNTATSGMITVNDAVSDSFTVQYSLAADPSTPLSVLSRHAGPEVDARNANLTMTAYGNVDINESVASAQTLRITSTAGSIVDGSIGDSRQSSGARPVAVYLSAAQDIGTSGDPFAVGTAGLVDARATTGSVHAWVYHPDSLFVSAGLDAVPIGPLGRNARIEAGRNVDVRGSRAVGDLAISSGQDTLVATFQAKSISVDAGRDAIFDFAGGDSRYASLWLAGGLNGSALSIIAARDILFVNNSGVSILGTDSNEIISTSVPQPSMTLQAGRNVVFQRLQTYGAVSIDAGTSITLENDFGPMIVPATIPQPIFTTDQGVASLTLSTPSSGSIAMQGARAVGDVAITTGSLTAARAISAGGTLSIITTQTPPFSNSGPAMGTMDEMWRNPENAPAIVPGPAVNPPAPPAALSALPTGAPGGLSVASATAPGTSGDLEEIPLMQEITELATKTAATSRAENGSAGSDAAPTEAEMIPLPTASIAQWLDFGRSGSFGPESSPGAEQADEERWRRR